MNKEEMANNELEGLKKKIKEELTKEEEYLNLQMRKEEIINNLKKSEANRYEAREILKQYEKIGYEIKEIELRMAYEVLKKEDKKVKKKFMGIKIGKNSKNENEYDEEFNNIVRDKNYKENIRIRSGIFSKMKKIFLESQNELYELESVETEIATMETDKLKELLAK